MDLEHGNVGIELADRLVAAGNQAEHVGQIAEACEFYRQAVSAAPSYAKAYLNWGVALEVNGDHLGAIRAYEAVLLTDDKNAPANYNLARILYASGELERSELLLRTALSSRPEFSDALVVLTNVLKSKGNFIAAAIALEDLLQHHSNSENVWSEYGDVLRQLGRIAEAAIAYQRMVELGATNASALSSYGEILRHLGRLKEAEEVFRRVLKFEVNAVPALSQLAGILCGDGRSMEGLEMFAAARRLEPNNLELESSELHSLLYSDAISDAEIYDRHCAFGRKIEKAFPIRFTQNPCQDSLKRKLRIGYVSCDFYAHPVSYFVSPLLQWHDRSSYTIYCYSINTRIDEVTKSLMQLADVWRDVSRLTEIEQADLINEDDIDILVDLAGHTGVSSLKIFSQQPSPVQVTWLGYINTTGLTRIRYRISDATCDPIGTTEWQHSETLVRLPCSQWCYRSFTSVVPASIPPITKNRFVTFGSFNNSYKISPTIRKAWIKILTSTPNSRLIIVGVTEGYLRDLISREFLEAGISPSRLTIIGRLPMSDYFSLFDAVDIALDSTPYSGGTTSCDTLWMGVPIVTMAGTRPVSRSTASILTTLGMTNWIASSRDEYVHLAVEFAKRDSVIIELRRSMRNRMLASNLMNEAQFVRYLEEAYRDMWQNWSSVR